MDYSDILNRLELLEKLRKSHSNLLEEIDHNVIELKYFIDHNLNGKIQSVVSKKLDDFQNIFEQSINEKIKADKLEFTSYLEEKKELIERNFFSSPSFLTQFEQILEGLIEKKLKDRTEDFSQEEVGSYNPEQNIEVNNDGLKYLSNKGLILDELINLIKKDSEFQSKFIDQLNIRKEISQIIGHTTSLDVTGISEFENRLDSFKIDWTEKFKNFKKQVENEIKRYLSDFRSKINKEIKNKISQEITIINSRISNLEGTILTKFERSETETENNESLLEGSKEESLTPDRKSNSFDESQIKFRVYAERPQNGYFAKTFKEVKPNATLFIIYAESEDSEDVLFSLIQDSDNISFALRFPDGLQDAADLVGVGFPNNSHDLEIKPGKVCKEEGGSWKIIQKMKIFWQ